MKKPSERIQEIAEENFKRTYPGERLVNGFMPHEAIIAIIQYLDEQVVDTVSVEDPEPKRIAEKTDI